MYLLSKRELIILKQFISFLINNFNYLIIKYLNSYARNKMLKKEKKKKKSGGSNGVNKRKGQAPRGKGISQAHNPNPLSIFPKERKHRRQTLSLSYSRSSITLSLSTPQFCQTLTLIHRKNSHEIQAPNSLLLQGFRGPKRHLMIRSQLLLLPLKP